MILATRYRGYTTTLKFVFHFLQKETSVVTNTKFKLNNLTGLESELLDLHNYKRKRKKVNTTLIASYFLRLYLINRFQVFAGAQVKENNNKDLKDFFFKTEVNLRKLD